MTAYPRATGKVEDLVQPVGGLISSVTPLSIQPGEPRFPIACAAVGDIGQALPSVAHSLEGRSAAGSLDGAGGSIDYEESRIRAIGEALERYSSCAYDEKQLLWASAEELGEEALDLETLPRCSQRELAHARCPLRAVDRQAPLRWVRGISLQDGRLVWIPAVMVYLHIPYLSPGERIWLPISTGCAAHTSVERALLGAMCEVIERDAIALTWLQRLELPRIELDVMPAWLEAYVEQNARVRANVEQLFFDATTDLGVPTVYSLQRSPHYERLAALVMCSTELDPALAIAKVMRESASSRIAMQVQQAKSDNWDDFMHVFDGAVYMGQRERLPAFDFLVQSPRRRRLSEMPVIGTGDARQDLIALLGRLRQRGMDVYAVDISSDEALRAGMRVVRVLIPALQPLSFSYRARYLGHARLYDAPRRMGYPVHDEDAINSWPQPFA